MPPPTRPTVPPQAPPEGDPSAVLGRLDLSSGERQPTPIELVGGRIRSVDVDRDFGGLDRGQQSIAFLGSRKRLSIISPPGDTRFLTITNPTEASEHTRDFLEAQNLTRPFDLRLPVRSPHDTLQVSQHLTSSAHNGPHLLHRALQSDMPIGINMATNKEGIAVRLGGAVFVIHPTLHDTGPNNVDSPSLTKTTPGGVDTTTTVTAGEMDTPPSYFAPTYSSREAIESARKESLQTPRRDGRCTYMTIDPNLFLRSPDESINAKRVFQTISGLATSQDFYITSDNRGNIVIIALTQRAGGSLARWANATFACTNNRANIFLGNDNLTQTETGLIIDNYLRTEELDNLRTLGQRTPEFRVRKSDFTSLSTGRDATLFKFRSREDTDDPDLLQIRISPEVQLRVGGGPDQLIGYDEELEELREATSSSTETKLSILKGNAGTGKSRLLHELVQSSPSTIVLSLDPAGEHVQGDGLVTVANQIAQALKDKLPPNERRKAEIAPLLDFHNKGEIVKLGVAQKKPDEIKNLCLNALRAYEAKEGGFTLVLDDVHHTDRHSDEHLMQLVHEFLDSTSGHAILAMRPEERYHSRTQAALETRVQSSFTSRNGLGQYVKTVSLVDEDGRPKLDLSDTDTATKYVFHSLPEELRYDPDTGDPKALGDWPRLLGEKAQTPFELTTFINTIIERPDLYLIVGKAQIDLKPEALTKIDDISGDLTIYHAERVATDLTPGARAVLECVALIGDKIPMDKLIAFARRNLEGMATNELEELTNKGFLVSKARNTYRFWHETIRDAVLQGMDTDSRRTLALKLHEEFRGEDTLGKDNRLALLQHAAPVQGEDEQRFWTIYGTTATEALEDATTHGTYGKGFGLAMTILDDLDSETKSTVIKAIGKMMKGAETAEQIRDFVVKALIGTIYNGVYLGRTQKAYHAIAILEKIETHRPGTANFRMIYLLGFEAAYITTDLAKLGEFHQKLRDKTNLAERNPRKNFLTDLKYTYKVAAAGSKDFTGCRDLCRGNPEILQTLETDPTNQDSLEIKRLIYRIRLEQTIQTLAQSGVDEDVITDPSLLSSVQSRELVELLESLAPLEERRRRDPSSFRPIEELFLLDQVAQTKSHLGHFDAACDDFKEIWRIAMQMEIYSQAARAAKLRGDMEIMQALCHVNGTTAEQRGHVVPFPNGIMLRNNILKAINTYTEEGFSALENMDENDPYHFVLRIQRVRAVGLLLLSYENEVKIAKSATPLDEAHLDKVRKEAAPHIAVALKDLEVLKSPPWDTAAADASGEVPYYLSSYTNTIVNIADQLGLESIDKPERSSDPYLSADAVHRGLQYFDSKTMHDNVGESLRKARSLINASLSQSAEA